MRSEEVKVRQADTADIETLAPLAARTFVDAFREHIPNDILLNYVEHAFSRQQLLVELSIPGSRFLIAEIDGQAVGYARLLSETPPGLDQALSGLRIVRMYVEHSMNRTGIGSVLMRAWLAQAVVQGEKTIWLRVWEHNHAAIGFYEKWGFQKVISIDFEMLGETRTDWVMQFSGIK